MTERRLKRSKDSFRCAQDFPHKDPEFGSSYTVPARIGYLRAAELILLGLPFNAKRAAELGLVTRVLADQDLLATATQTARDLAKKPPAALQACKRLMKSSTRDQLERAVKLENEEFSARVRSAEAKEAFTAFTEKRKPNFEQPSRNQKHSRLKILKCRSARKLEKRK